MNVVDSSGWLEYFADGTNASHFAAVLRDSEQLVVPSVSVYEVFKVLLRESGENAALQGAAAMQRVRVVDFTAPLAMAAAVLSLKYSPHGRQHYPCHGCGLRGYCVDAGR